MGTSPVNLAHEVADLVSLPEIYLKVREIMDDPAASFTDMAKVIAVDPGMTARISESPIAPSVISPLGSRPSSMP